MTNRRSVIKHPHDYAGAPQILSPVEGFGERFDPEFLQDVGSSSIRSGGGSSNADYSATRSNAPPAGMTGSSSGSGSVAGASSSSRNKDFDLVPHRSAPLPPEATAPSSPSVFIRSGGAGVSKAPITSPYISSSSSSFRPMSHDSQSSSSAMGSTNGVVSPSIRSGFPSASPGLPSGYAGTSGGPPRPVRSQTGDSNSRIGLVNGAGGGGPSGFVPSSARSHASVGGPAPSPHLSSPHQSPRAPPSAFDTATMSNSIEDVGNTNQSISAPPTPAAPASQFSKGNAAKGVASGNEAGRSTFKNVFGGFVNSMSGECTI